MSRTKINLKRLRGGNETVSRGRFERFGLSWQHGDTFQYRHWLALRLLDKSAARLYFQTTR